MISFLDWLEVELTNLYECFKFGKLISTMSFYMWRDLMDNEYTPMRRTTFFTWLNGCKWWEILEK